jgi:hypothetical protein
MIPMALYDKPDELLNELYNTDYEFTKYFP